MKRPIKLSLLIFILIGFCQGITAQTKWYNPLEGDEPYISGRAWNSEIGKSYARLPQRLQETMSGGVASLSNHSAGLYVRFLTTSPEIKVKYTLGGGYDFKNMAPLNHSGVDIYATDANGETHWIGNHMAWDFNNTPGDTITFAFRNVEAKAFKDRGLLFELLLPPYNQVTSLQIGVNEGSSFKFFKQSAERPIVIYGSSIVQGASSSRPGLMWTNIVRRETDYPVVNLGFSGLAYMEPEHFDAISEIDARAYILDPMPNSYSLGDKIVPRLMDGVKKIRQKSDAPILLVESAGSVDSVWRKDVNDSYRQGDAELRKAYEQLQKDGVKNIFYLSHNEIGMTEDCYIEGTHPNDIGNMKYAKAVERKIREMLPEDWAPERYAPVMQHRDWSYEWYDRHNEVIERNHTKNPEILMIGNSITHFWGGEPISRCLGGDTFKKLVGKRSATNMGFGWDRIENVFWRIHHGELEGCSPKHICLLIGVNNLYNGDSDEDIANGIAALAKIINERQPQAKLHVIKIYPAAGAEERIKRINDLMESLLPLNDKIDVLDFTETLTLKDGSGKIDPTLFLPNEGLHPIEKGYDKLVKALKPHLK